MAEDINEKLEAELDEEFAEEYKKLRQKYGRDISIEMRTTIVRVDIPK